MYDMYPWPANSAADAAKPEPAINAVQVALDRRDNGGEVEAAARMPVAGPTRQ